MGDYTGTHTVIFRGFFSFLLFSRRNSEAASRGGGGSWGGGIVFFRVPISLQGCDGWGKRQGIYHIFTYDPLSVILSVILYIKASFVQWKDIRSWQPHNSLRVRRSSVGCSIAQKGTVYAEGAA